MATERRRLVSRREETALSSSERHESAMRPSACHSGEKGPLPFLAHEQRLAEPGLKLLQMTADRGVRDVEPSGGRPHAAGFVDRGERAKHRVGEIHFGQ